MKKFIIVLIISILKISLFAQIQDKIIKKTDWNAYTQTRFTTNFQDNYNFSLRRLKFWVKSSPEFSDRWYYKIQTTLSSIKNETFFLQDVKIGYKTGIWSFDIGQFVPQYSLQRFQPDYLLPVIERAKAINSLIPDGTFGVRDIGFQANLKTKNKLLQTHFGIFNGYGIKKYRINNKGVMLTHKTALNFDVSHSKIKTGYSLMFRKADNQEFPKVLPDTVFYSGNDFRYNVFLSWENRFIELQAEYLTAFFNKQKAEGYYFLSGFTFNKHQIVFAYEYYRDLISETADLPFVHFGYNYLINRYKAKLFFDNYFQITNESIQNYSASIQLQFFLTQ